MLRCLRALFTCNRGSRVCQNPAEMLVCLSETWSETPVAVSSRRYVGWVVGWVVEMAVESLDCVVAVQRQKSCLHAEPAKTQ